MLSSLRLGLRARRSYIAPLHTTRYAAAVSNFTMPALSPTMTEGNIAGWKLKEGDSYIAGDVLLEIETDKATMDVEAQDDGVLGKILVADGAKAVQVGAIIAIMAEDGDDLSAIEIPREESVKAQGDETTKAMTDKKSTLQPETPAKQPVAPLSKTQKKLLTSAPIYSPAVALLLAKYGIQDAPKISATGPMGRLLKADVLVHAKMIKSEASRDIQDAYEKRSRLDLSNIKLAPQEKQAPSKSFSEPIVKPEVIELNRKVNMQQLLLLSENLSQQHDFELTMAELATKAAKRALQDVPRFGLKQRSLRDVQFDAIIGKPSKPEKALSTLPKPLNTMQASIDVSEHFANILIPMPSRIPASLLFAINKECDSKTRASVKTSIDALDYLTGSPRSKPIIDDRKSQVRKSRDIVATISFEKGTVDCDIAMVFLDRTVQYIESPAHLLLF